MMSPPKETGTVPLAHQCAGGDKQDDGAVDCGELARGAAVGWIKRERRRTRDGGAADTGERGRRSLLLPRADPDDRGGETN